VLDHPTLKGVGVSLGGSSDLPAYTVRISQRARHVRLTVTPRDGLVVVVPARWRGSSADIADIVADKRDWAETALARIAEERALHAGGPEALLPDRVELRAFSASWPVEYRATSAASVSARVTGATLVVAGNVADAEACLAALTRWLDREARALLLPMLAEVAADADVAYASARVRKQRSRWGSCSSRQTISLSRNLVFVPEHLVRALMLHELAHTRVMNHSRRFWDTLAQLDPAAHEHRAQMRDMSRLVPAWADA
jgi:predicted metal-dependent hydrolase